MDLNSIGQFIANYGFPIVACGALFWQNMKQEENNKESMNKLTTVISENTKAIDKILVYIQAVDKEENR